MPDDSPKLNRVNTTVALILVARNEEATIGACLNDFLAQTYPKELTELIVVDDDSVDGTAGVVEQFITANPSYNVKLIRLKDEAGVVSYKKRAVATAIAQSTGSLIVTTDADCRFGSQRIETIVNYYENNPVSLILMPVLYSPDRNFFGGIQSFEYTGIMGITAASAGLGKPVSCNAANMALERKLLDRLDGFDNNYASGDDVFLLYKAKKRIPQRIKFLNNNAVIVTTPPEATLSSFFNQRVRWGAKAKGYTDKEALVSIILLFASNAAVVLAWAMALVFKGMLGWAAFIFGFKFFTDVLFIWPILRFYGKTYLLPYYPLASLWMPLYISITGILSIKGTYFWKGRKLH